MLISTVIVYADETDPAPSSCLYHLLALAEPAEEARDLIIVIGL